MVHNKLNEIRNKVMQQNPLIHCITNPISINQCANALLAVGASPIMAEHPLEVSEITQTAGALLLNMGNITDVRMQSMEISANTAKINNIPFVIDTVGISCSVLRRKFANDIIEKYTPTLIKGNYSEITALYNTEYKSVGVDAHQKDENAVLQAAKAVAQKYGTIVLASGKKDIITDGKIAVFISNGTPRLASITGTGCMQGALCAAYLSAERSIWGCACGCAVMGIIGQKAESVNGSGSFLVKLMDELSLLDSSDIEKYLFMEVKSFEKA